MHVWRQFQSMITFHFHCLQTNGHYRIKCITGNRLIEAEMKSGSEVHASIHLFWYAASKITTIWMLFYAHRIASMPVFILVLFISFVWRQSACYTRNCRQKNDFNAFIFISLQLINKKQRINNKRASTTMWTE